MSNCDVVTFFPIGILGQVWRLVVSIPDLCTLSYFYAPKGRQIVITLPMCLSIQVMSGAQSFALPTDTTLRMFYVVLLYMNKANFAE